jgi:hypothetical protein
MTSFSNSYRRHLERPTTASSVPEGSRRRLIESEPPTFPGQAHRPRPSTASASSPSRKVIPLPGVTSQSFHGKRNVPSAIDRVDTGLDRARSLSISPKLSLLDREAITGLIALVEDSRTPKIGQDGYDALDDMKREIQEVRAENQRLVDHIQELQVVAYEELGSFSL